MMRMPIQIANCANCQLGAMHGRPVLITTESNAFDVAGKMVQNHEKQFKVHVIQFKMLHFNFLMTFINVQELSAKDDFCFVLLIIDQVQIPSLV